ncbi:ATP-binding protein [Marinilabiliaceae bacterium ANBcel2]|nr:ATP-binding protein [Marinilabiliaceae bacterium ANBcel2]
MISIVISGPESTGKSTMTKQLANYFNCLFVEEYARDYVQRLNREYLFSDVETIAIRQIASYKIMQKCVGMHSLVVFDTFLIITKIWFEEVYQCCPLFIHEAIKMYKPNLVFLCYPDIEWKHDGVRENKDKRLHLFYRYREELERYNISYNIVSGYEDARITNVIKLVSGYCNFK